MRTSTHTVSRFQPMHPWANRILHVDLGDKSAWAEPSEEFLPEYLGSRGIAARLCWRDYPEPVPAFDPANPLMVVPGALTGSRAPYSGRTTIHAFSPQAWPHEWFTRSSIGGHFGGELKRAGYDALVVTGAAETPVRLQIVDDQVSVLPADDLWGLDIFDALEALDAAEGRGACHLTIGPAGENLSRIATIQTASSSAAGQGGFGAVMGSKKLKAISVRGSGKVELADPVTMTALSRAMATQLKRGMLISEGRLDVLNTTLNAERGGRANQVACTEGCPTPCQALLQDMPGVTNPRRSSGAYFCVAPLMEGFPRDLAEGTIWDWHQSFYAAFEHNALANRYGLNLFDLLCGVVPWLNGCRQGGLVSSLEGRQIDWCDAAWWDHFLRITATRQGVGDTLAEGGRRAAVSLGIGEDIAAQLYPNWGQSGQSDGHTWGAMFFPYWLVTALMCLHDTRAPLSGIIRAARACSTGLTGDAPGEREAGIARARRMSQRVYGTPQSLDPTGGYAGKAIAGHHHTGYAAMLDAIPLDTLTFPLLWDPLRWDPEEERANDDGVHWLRAVDGMGDVDGLKVEELVWEAGTGLGWDRGELDAACHGVVTLDRALQVRHWGRDRELDETVLPHYERTELGMSPVLGERYGLDRDQFAPVLTEFYSLHGWDANGQPARERMDELGMGEMHEEMVEGATEAAARLEAQEPSEC